MPKMAREYYKFCFIGFAVIVGFLYLRLVGLRNKEDLPFFKKDNVLRRFNMKLKQKIRHNNKNFLIFYRGMWDIFCY